MSNSSSSSGVGFVGLLTITFIVLKLTEIIDWKWLWVLSPAWIGITIIVAGFLFATMMFYRKKRHKS